MPLSDVALKAAAPGAKQYKLFDGGGLFLLVTPNGSKLWRQKYRFGGKEKLLSHGPYPLISLREARAKRDGVKRVLLDGNDPAAIRRRQKRDASAAGTSFRALAAEYIELAEKERKASATIKKRRWLLHDLASELHPLSIDEIRPTDVLPVLRKIEGEGHYETANRMRSAISGVFRFAIASGRAETDPTSGLRGALVRPVVTPRAAITSAAEFGELLRRIDGYEGEPTTRIGLQLLALLACRPGELRNARWSEFDIERRVWRIPSGRMKMGRDHHVPLPPATLELLSELGRIAVCGDLLLPSRGKTHTPISENTFNGALRQMGFRKEEMTAHGFRAAFSTLANEDGRWNADAIERSLAHVDASRVREAYARGEYWGERVRLAVWWANQLDMYRRLPRAPNT